MTRDSFGLVTDPPHPVLFELLYEPQLAADRRDTLPHLLQIDASHLVMLAERGLLPEGTCGSLLEINRDLARRVESGEEVLGQPSSHRGLYILYETEYVSRLGPKAGGAAHYARSRNDINATITRMRLRAACLSLVRHGIDLVRAGTAQAQHHLETVMPGFTHLQPAQPTTLGHYMAGLLSELLRSIEALSDAYPLVDRSPMGAAAGFGTSVAIDRRRVADLLGFSSVIDNSLDAIASRDYLVAVMSPVSLLGVSITRLATDLQGWGSVAYGFLDWPDALISTSSIMPQKRNAYVFETIRGRAVRPVSALHLILLGLKNVGFSNSVEVSGELPACVWPALESAETAVRLSTLLVENARVDRARMLEFLGQTVTTMTELANLLVRRAGISFRQAHEAVAQIVREGLRDPDRVRYRLTEIFDGDLALEPAEVQDVLDPVACARASEFGGGPGRESVARQLSALGERLRVIQRRLGGWESDLRAAEARLSEAVEAVLHRS